MGTLNFVLLVVFVSLKNREIKLITVLEVQMMGYLLELQLLYMNFPGIGWLALPTVL